MVGGTVIGFIRNPNGLTRINVQGTGCETHDTRVVEVRDEKHEVEIGDSIWWQCRRAFVLNSLKETVEIPMIWNS